MIILLYLECTYIDLGLCFIYVTNNYNNSLFFKYFYIISRTVNLHFIQISNVFIIYIIIISCGNIKTNL